MARTGLEEELANSQGVILFDGDCAFCRRIVGLLLRVCQDRHILVCSVRSPRGEAAAKAIGGNPAETFAFLTADRVAVGVEAYTEILMLTPRTAWIARIAGATPRFLSDRVYNWVGDHRRLMSRLWGRPKRDQEPIL